MKKVLITIVAILLVIAIGVGVLAIVANNYISNQSSDDIPDSVEIEANELKTITAVGRGLYDENGDRFEIKGINFGNLFIAEGWMTVNSVGPLYNEDGSFVKVNEQGIVEEYEEIYQEEMDAILAERFTDSQLETLNDAYFYSYCTEQDFINIKEIGSYIVHKHQISKFESKTGSPSSPLSFPLPITTVNEAP